tara:strand:+ start:236 stop:469 length:234 start_codon:yes stop_codon:yes gene_type:complete
MMKKSSIPTIKPLRKILTPSLNPVMITIVARAILIEARILGPLVSKTYPSIGRAGGTNAPSMGSVVLPKAISRYFAT